MKRKFRLLSFLLSGIIAVSSANIVQASLLNDEYEPTYTIASVSENELYESANEEPDSEADEYVSESAAVFDESMNTENDDVLEADSGTTFIDFNGEYFLTGKDTILKRLNQIRKEACDEGINGLTSSDYVPLKWSNDLEDIARRRAAEADLYESHTRPNGKSCFTVYSRNGQQAYAENLAWNNEGLMRGIEQFYEEKKAFVNKTGGQTGHYLSIINPRYRTVGMGCYRMDGKFWYGVAQEFSPYDGLSETQDSTKGRQKISIECLNENIISATISPKKNTEIQIGETHKLKANATVCFKAYTQLQVTGTVLSGYCWFSSNEAIATVDNAGLVTGVSVGDTKISFKTGGLESSIKVTVYKPLDLATECYIEFQDNSDSFTYTGYPIEPEPLVKVKENNSILTLGKDYTITAYAENINVGTAMMAVTGCGRNKGVLGTTFRITPASVVILPRELTLKRGTSIPANYPYVAYGLQGEDVIKDINVSTGAVDMNRLGDYVVSAKGAKIVNGMTGASSDKNYNVVYSSATVRVAVSEVVCRVCFDVDGSLTYRDVICGDLIENPPMPAKTGYELEGYYTDLELKNKWDFEKDVVYADLKLYPKWTKSMDKEMKISVIPDYVFTGSKIKPKVLVYANDILLVEKKDYKVEYANNLNVNKTLKTGDGLDTVSLDLPCVKVIGIGNYEGEVCANFNIVPRPLDSAIGDVSCVVNYKNQLVYNKDKDQKIVSKVTLKKQLVEGVDYDVVLVAANAKDPFGEKITPGKEVGGNAIRAGYSGSFAVMINGKNNYSGYISKMVVSADKTLLLKYATITLGNKVKKVEYSNAFNGLKAGTKDAMDCFTVKLNGKIINPTCYDIIYENTDKVGKATMIISAKDGMGYFGEKTATFNIVGKSIKKENIIASGITDRVYNGKAQIQEDLSVAYKDSNGVVTNLRKGYDYTISYKNNIKKGTAALTIKGNKTAGYSGSATVNYKIAACDIADSERILYPISINSIVTEYDASGAKINSAVILYQKLSDGTIGRRLIEGKDYVITYKKNKKLYDGMSEDKPTAVIQGKGNYKGKYTVEGFKIKKKSISSSEILIGDLSIVQKYIPFDENMENGYEYKPKVAITYKKTTLKAGKDFEVIYLNNTQENVKAYINDESGAARPEILIKAPDESGYDFNGLTLGLGVYKTKLTASNVNVSFSESSYNQSETMGTILPSFKVIYEGRELTYGRDYLVEFSKVKSAGAGKGKAKISMLGPVYGGSFTIKYDVNKRKIR